MAKLIDTNYLLRYLLCDNELMYDTAKRVISEGAETLPESIAEIVYVLKGVYNIERQQIAAAVSALLKDVGVQNKERIAAALAIYADSSFDYVDCLYLASAQQRNENIFTFDKKMNNYMKNRFGL